MKFSKVTFLCFLLGSFIQVSCTSYHKELRNLQRKVESNQKEVKTGKKLLKVHYVTSQIPVLGEEQALEFELVALTGINELTIGFVAKEGLAINRGDRYRKYLNTRKDQVIKIRVRIKPESEGVHKITMYGLMKIPDGIRSKTVTIPVKIGIKESK